MKIVIAAFLIFGPMAANADVIITFDETITATGLGNGFNGLGNEFLITSDGNFRAEAFFLNQVNFGHFHTDNSVLFGGPVGYEQNHNFGGSSPSNLEGIRITRVDGGSFKLVSMDLFGGVAIGFLTDFTTGAGDWTLYANVLGSLGSGNTVFFEDDFLGLSEIYLVDPGIANGGFGISSWDNITVPEPGTLALLGIGLFGMGMSRRRRKV